MTGKHTGRAFIRGNAQSQDSEGQLPIPDEEKTLAEALQDAGYVTGMFGKWGLGNPGTTGDPLKQGWDTYLGYTDQVRAHNYFPDFLLKDGKRIPLDNEVTYLPKDQWHKGVGSHSTGQNVYSHDVVEEGALDFIREHKDSPFFLYVPFTLPHDNGEALELKMEVPDFGRYADRDWGINHKGYAEMVTRLDASTGRILDLIDELGLGENTIVLFTSDNGPMAPKKGNDDLSFSLFFDSNGPFTGYKRDITEGGIRAPLIVRWTGKVQPGTTTDFPSVQYDYFRTFCDLAGAPEPTGTDGVSLVPMITGNPTEQKQPGFLYWEDAEDGDIAIRQGDWKALLRDLDKNPDAKLELYNLETDPAEENDLASTESEKATELRQLIGKVRTPSEHFPSALDGK